MSRTKLVFTLAGLLPELDLAEFTDIKITGLSQDSREVVEGDLFVARAGMVVDGRTYIEQAIKAGASAVLVQGYASEATELSGKHRGVPFIAWDSARLSLGVLADRFFGHPSSQLQLVGLTGTNGKTSSAHFLVQALTHMGVKTGLLGTLGTGFISALSTATHTTPDAIAVHKTLAELLEQGAKAVVMEVSSHAIDQGRIDGLSFDLVAYTNLSRDHLDYHQTLERYAQAKQRLFEDYAVPLQLFNADDFYPAQLLAQSTQGVRREGFSSTSDAFVSLLSLNQHSRGLDFKLRVAGQSIQLELPLLGRFNVENLMLVAGALNMLGYDLTKIEAAMSQIVPVVGRMQLLVQDQAPAVIVDYAHTPDALEKALSACKEHLNSGCLYLMFGCGGDRDRGKRALMAEIAERLADQIWITSDNPRTEDPEAIIQEIILGLKKPQAARIEPDRNRAIAEVIESARADDLVLLAGKGHESYQEINGQRYPFSDIEHAKSALLKRRAA